MRTNRPFDGTRRWGRRRRKMNFSIALAIVEVTPMERRPLTAARRPDAAVPVTQFLTQEHLQDARLDPYLKSAQP